MLEFVLARYNYWIVIALMMTGLYIVFSRGNLVKTLIGLNLFQTSVFIFYITVGKVIGGTAPILVGGHAEEEGHGEPEGHGGETGASHAPSHGPAEETHTEDTAAHIDAATEAGSGDTDYANPVRGAGGGESLSGESLHLEPEPGMSNDLFTSGSASGAAPGAEPSVELPGLDTYGEVIYSNPLPHVLILTAIVVGVATTAVGLSLAVRIREAYGTVEEDDLESINNAAEAAEARA